MLVFDLFCVTLCSFEFCNYLEEYEKAGCFQIAIIFLVNVSSLIVLLYVLWSLHLSTHSFR